MDKMVSLDNAFQCKVMRGLAPRLIYYVYATHVTYSLSITVSY